MNFDLTDEQRMLRDTLAGFLQRRYSLDSRRAALAREGWQPDIWHGFANELGLFGAALDEAEGGFGGGPVETMLIAEELGRALVIEPYVEAVVVATALLRGAAAADEVRSRIVAGSAVVVPALYEAPARFDPLRIATSIRHGQLTGTKTVVAAAPIATHLLVSAIEEGSPVLCLVNADAAGIERRDYTLIDGRPAADVTFSDVVAARIDVGDARDRIERAIDDGIAAICAEAVGVIDAMLARTVDYTRQREQFGVAIASFQVLQHRMAGMATLLERARSMSVMATLALDLPAIERRHAISAAKAFVGEALKVVGEGAIQLHGGIGTTEDIAISHYFKRATTIQSQFGTTAYHLKRMADADRP